MPIISREPINAKVQITCSSKFGISSKISSEQVWNMYETDGFMVNFAGYKQILDIVGNASGRGGYVSIRGGFILIVYDSDIYIIDKSFKYNYIGSLETSSGDVFIEENNASQIAICDKLYIYIYNYSTGVFAKVNTNFRPIHIAFQNGYFLAPEANSYQWRLSDINNGLVWSDDVYAIGVFQEADDEPLAIIPIPSVKGQVLIFGSNKTVCFYHDQNAQLFPYRRNNSFGIDYGCVNPATIDYNDKFIVWLGANKKSALSIMYTTGGLPQQITTDGIHVKLEKLNNPNKATGSLYEMDGHLFYQINFYDKKDNFSLVFDFTTKKFFNISDENQEAHPARRVFYFNNKNYFFTSSDGFLYEISSNYYSYNGFNIPKIIITPTFRLPNTGRFLASRFTFIIEQGEEIEAVNAEPLIQKGDIELSDNFPSETPNKGDIYKIIGSVNDDDPTKTNTGQKFSNCYIVWNGLKWDIVYDLYGCVDLAISFDGGKTFSNFSRRELNKIGKRKNILEYRKLGLMNELTLQLRFYGNKKFIVSNGEVIINK